MKDINYLIEVYEELKKYRFSNWKTVIDFLNTNGCSIGIPFIQKIGKRDYYMEENDIRYVLRFESYTTTETAICAILRGIQLIEDIEVTGVTDSMTLVSRLNYESERKRKSKAVCNRLERKYKVRTFDELGYPNKVYFVKSLDEAYEIILLEKRIGNPTPTVWLKNERIAF